MAIFSVEPLQPVTGKSQVPSKESHPIVELSIANALRHIRDRPPSRSSRRLALDREERDRTAYGRRTDHDPPPPPLSTVHVLPNSRRAPCDLVPYSRPPAAQRTRCTHVQQSALHSVPKCSSQGHSTRTQTSSFSSSHLLAPWRRTPFTRAAHSVAPKARSVPQRRQRLHSPILLRAVATATSRAEGPSMAGAVTGTRAAHGARSSGRSACPRPPCSTLRCSATRSSLHPRRRMVRFGGQHVL